VDQTHSSKRIRDQLVGELNQFRAAVESKAKTLSCIDYFLWHTGIEESLELGRQMLYARLEAPAVLRRSGHE
jgi:hypothetical protein